jgi:hypothetical protein
MRQMKSDHGRIVVVLGTDQGLRSFELSPEDRRIEERDTVSS